MDDHDIQDKILAKARSNFAEHLGARLTTATPDRVEFEMPVTSVLANTNGVLHGGAIMGLADNVGGVATILNLPENRATTTVESKTNFLRPVRMGETVRAVAEPLHRGSTTQVWQTRIMREDGKVAAIVTQTQLVLEWRDKHA
ncbi:PaaI family thioesterase [Paracoccus sp. Z330]|uniref:PaaI family thioesterase n=1 Tax=Paracoccus onchidii TaxID=3017813 RepID=A0ABT4ZIS9_9RHOB|nr:PaaI family thioesterase [Paracoccus onchidii]MDB6178898.1 PaaI family thioesterase [Paracoccus onchidii]